MGRGGAVLRTCVILVDLADRKTGPAKAGGGARRTRRGSTELSSYAKASEDARRTRPVFGRSSRIGEPGVFGSPAWCSARRGLGSFWPRAGSARQGSPKNPGPCGFMPRRQCSAVRLRPNEPGMRRTLCEGLLDISHVRGLPQRWTWRDVCLHFPLWFLATLETTSPVNGGGKESCFHLLLLFHRSDAAAPADVPTFQRFGALRNPPVWE